MLDHARFEAAPARRTAGPAVLAAAALLALLPAAAAAADPPPAVPPVPDLPVLGAPALPAPVVPDAPALAAPPAALVSAGCRGARRRSAARHRRGAVRCLVNRARARAGLRGFRPNRSLARAAQRHARDMARGHYFGHQRAGGPSVERRVRRTGWRGRHVGEAIAYGCGSAASPLAIVHSWLASPPHAAILLSRELGRAGIGSSRAPISCRGASFVLVAGRG